MPTSRSRADALLARLEGREAATGTTSWAGIARRYRPLPHILLRLPAPPPGRRPGPEASPLTQGLWQASAWHYARARAAALARAEGRDTIAATLGVGEVGSYDPSPTKARQEQRHAASEAPEAVTTPQDTEDASQRSPRGAYQTGDEKLAAFNARRRAAGLLPPL